jgi:hypothetical protein
MFSVFSVILDPLDARVFAAIVKVFVRLEAVPVPPGTERIYQPCSSW